MCVSDEESDEAEHTLLHVFTPEVEGFPFPKVDSSFLFTSLKTLSSTTSIKRLFKEAVQSQ